MPQYPIDTVSYSDSVFFGLEMDVAGVLFYSACNNSIDKANYRLARSDGW